MTAEDREGLIEEVLQANFDFRHADGRYVLAEATLAAALRSEIEAHAKTRAELERVDTALRGLLGEWDKLARYGSPLAKQGNEAVAFARSRLAKKGEGG